MTADRDEERVEAAAIQVDGKVYSLPRPARHHDVIRMMCEEHGFKRVDGGETQGFVTSYGRFVDRRMARILAVRAGQVTKPPHSELYSEDVW